MPSPLLSICIPLYNRVNETRLLLESIISQLDIDTSEVELVLCEDNSPERSQISALVRSISNSYPNLPIIYHQNPVNLGYDGNIRKLISVSSGSHCLFYGNDDISPAGSINTVLSIIKESPDIGVIVRSYYTFTNISDQIHQSFRYLPSDAFFEPGLNALLFSYRRSVVISGLVLHRKASLSIESALFDGTLLYQLYLVGLISQRYCVIFTRQYLSAYRLGGIPDFGHAPCESAYQPGLQTFESSLAFVSGAGLVANWGSCEKQSSATNRNTRAGGAV